MEPEDDFGKANLYFYNFSRHSGDSFSVFVNGKKSEGQVQDPDEGSLMWETLFESLEEAECNDSDSSASDHKGLDLDSEIQQLSSKISSLESPFQAHDFSQKFK